MRIGSYYRYLVLHSLKLPLTGKKILDIGGYDGFLLSRIPGETKTLIDISPRSLYPDIHYIEGDFLAFDFKDDKFDLICAFDVIEHVKDDRDFLEKIVHLLSPEGRALLSTPSEKIQIFPSFLQKWVDKKWGHVYRRGYSQQTLTSMITERQGKNLDMRIMEWNAQWFRFFYFPLWISWRLWESFTKKILNRIVLSETARQDGENGYLFFILTKKKGDF